MADIGDSPPPALHVVFDHQIEQLAHPDFGWWRGQPAMPLGVLARHFLHFDLRFAQAVGTRTRGLSSVANVIVRVKDGRAVLNPTTGQTSKILFIRSSLLLTSSSASKGNVRISIEATIERE